MKKTLVLVMLVMAIVVVATFGFTACNKEDNTEKTPVVKVVDVKLTSEEYAFCVNKSNTELLAKVNEYIALIKSNGTYDEILNHNMNSASSPVLVESAPEGTANALVVVTEASFPPFESMRGQYFIGIDMEIAKGLAEYLSRPLVIKSMDFDGIFSVVEAGNADIGMAGITVTDERKQIITFSETYYDSAQVVIAKNGDTLFDACTKEADVVEILKNLPAGTKVGVQNGTTGYLYVVGDESLGFDGYSNITYKGYATVALAVQDMLNGNIDYVIADEAPAKKIADNMNKF